jgi:hypothetical protein
VTSQPAKQQASIVSFIHQLLHFLIAGKKKLRPPLPRAAWHNWKARLLCALDAIGVPKLLKYTRGSVRMRVSEPQSVCHGMSVSVCLAWHGLRASQYFICLHITLEAVSVLGTRHFDCDNLAQCGMSAWQQ